MSNDNPAKFRQPLLLSLFLHLLILIVIGFAAFTRVPSSNNNGSNIAAVVVDTKIVSEEYRRRLEQQIANEKHQQQMKKQALEKSKFVEKQKIIQQRRLKELEKQRLAALKQRQLEVAAAKVAAEEKKRALEQAAKAIAEAEQAKKMAEEIKKKINAQINHQKEQELSNILNDLALDRPHSPPTEVVRSEIDHYRSLVRGAISRNFTNAKLYVGKNCTIKIILAPDGLLIGVEAVEGDPLLCREAESATKKAVIPRPTSDWMYQKVKNLTIDFRPE